MDPAAVTVATIGFTRTSAEDFFARLARAGVRRVIDVRLRNTSQLSGFAKAGDLAWFLRTIAGIDYVHEPRLAPTDGILTPYRTGAMRWDAYAPAFLDLMAARRIETTLTPEDLDGACLLCSEALPHHCHRRLVVDYLNERWNGRLTVAHL